MRAVKYVGENFLNVRRFIDQPTANSTFGLFLLKRGPMLVGGHFENRVLKDALCGFRCQTEAGLF